jgi:hypothetical protein
MNVHTLFIATAAAVMLVASFWFSQRIDALESKVYQNRMQIQEIGYMQNIDVPEVVKTLTPKIKKEK